MTTVAYRDGVLATDSLVSSDGNHCGYSVKGGSLKGLLFAATGDASWCWRFRDWIRLGLPEGQLPDPPNTSTGGMLIMPDDSLIFFHNLGIERRIDLPYYADGSGHAYATGAMHHGATAEEAIRAAIEWDLHTGGQVVTYRR